jgi:hypothetical protein
MAKKDKATNGEEPKESKLDRVFKPFLPSHHVSFAQLKDILSQLAGDETDETQDDQPV